MSQILIESTHFPHSTKRMYQHIYGQQTSQQSGVWKVKWEVKIFDVVGGVVQVDTREKTIVNDVNSNKTWYVLVTMYFFFCSTCLQRLPHALQSYD